jgi:general secretion pathway protein G
VLLLGILLTNLVPTGCGFARGDFARRDLAWIAKAVLTRSDQAGSLPDPNEFPRVLTEPGREGEPPPLDPDLLEDGRLLDPWGNPYVYGLVGTDAFELRSYGRDGRPDGEGQDSDIVLRSQLRPARAPSRPAERR